jgi:hypothetical protein
MYSMFPRDVSILLKMNLNVAFAVLGHFILLVTCISQILGKKKAFYTENGFRSS